MSSSRQRPSRVPAVRHGQLRRSTPWISAAKIVAGALAVVLVSGASVGAYAVWDVVSSIKPSVDLGKESPPPKSIDSIEGGVNLLLVGSDSRQGQDPALFGDPTKETGVLNDVTMLLHISEDHSAATVVSFPRDMFVPIPSCPKPEGGTYPAMSSQKINTTLGYGGLACTVKTVEALTGLDIPYAAEVQFSGVIELSNAVGGVEVCVAKGISDPYTGTFLDAGNHTLQGLAALQFLRTRHGVGDGSDLGRISNQQVFLSSLVRTLQSSNTLSDPTKLFSIAKAAVSNMTLSTSLNDVNTMVQIALALKNIPLDQIVFVQYPNAIVNKPGHNGVEPLPGPAKTLFDAIKSDQHISLTGGTGLGSVTETPAGGTETPAAPPAGGSQTPAAPPAGGSQTPAAPPAGGSSTTPTDPSAPPAVVELPSTVTGQSAGEQTCSAGNKRK
ncbi:LCP family protein [Mycetocola sp. JXN-3]|uniref:LCP family protein n=1 Tax=Mycetocola sp. JXN-3 TaxID=2116510 RepID=UPI00165CEF03|nr:LCP family protein [Mycetocola sp. JXN-3]